MTDWRASLGREPGAEDQPPGYYRVRPGGQRGKRPWMPVRLVLTDDGMWHCLVIGSPVHGSPQSDPSLIPFVRQNGPFREIAEAEYYALIAEYDAAGPGSPLLTPNEPINLRNARAQ